MEFSEAIKRALRNIGKHGDTDIFPFPFERHLFFDRESDCQKILEGIDSDFKSALNSRPPSTITSLSQVGYTGFRWATQIEPFWNAYFLACVIGLADQIEAERVPEEAQAVFSYRYSWDPDKAKLFKDSAWADYRTRGIELSKTSKYVVVTDIADFYPRIYHHRIENALDRLPSAGDLPGKIMSLLNAFSKNVSYGLPIGGPASRILAELALNSVDKHLLRRHVRFCRYADDFCIFCDDRADAHRVLVLLSEKLFNEGLVLQKKKTRIQTVEEFREGSKLLDPQHGDDAMKTEEEKLLGISIRYDPYSQTADEDYEELKNAVNDVDIVGILGREVAKTAIDATVAKQAIGAIRALKDDTRIGAIRTLLQRENLEVLAPVFVTVMRTIRTVYDDLDEDGKDFVDKSLIALFDANSYLLGVELHLAYYVQVLSQRPSTRKEEILVEIFESQTSPLIRRIVTLTMAGWDCHYWISDVKQKYGGLTEWERRSMIIGSYCLGDEGKHWRNNTKKTWNEIELLIRDWYSDRIQNKQNVPI
jgi:hypothetical protein